MVGSDRQLLFCFSFTISIHDKISVLLSESFSFRFRTDANEGGVEKLTVTRPSKAYLEGAYRELPQLVEGEVLIIF